MGMKECYSGDSETAEDETRTEFMDMDMDRIGWKKDGTVIVRKWLYSMELTRPDEPRQVMQQGTR